MGGGTREVAVASEGLRGRRSFATTDWTLVAQAGEPGTVEGAVALEELCRIYWMPLYSFARRHGLSAADAEDLTQGFFEDLLARGAIARADPERGRFRTFLLASFKHYHAHQREAAGRKKRGGGRRIVSLEALQEAEAQLRAEPNAGDTPERCYDRKWAAGLLARALAAVRRDYEAAGRTAWFDELRGALWGGRGEVGRAEIASRLGTTEGAVRSAMHRLRRRVGEHIRAEVAKTVVNREEVDDEIRHLFAAVSR